MRPTGDFPLDDATSRAIKALFDASEEPFDATEIKLPQDVIDIIPQERVTGDVLRGRGPRRGNLEKLLKYWRPIMRKPGGFRRCLVILADHPELYPLQRICAWLHHETTGLWPNEGNHHGGGKAGKLVKRTVKKRRRRRKSAEEIVLMPGVDFPIHRLERRLERKAGSILNVPLDGTVGQIEYKSSSKAKRVLSSIESVFLPGEHGALKPRHLIQTVATPGGSGLPGPGLRPSLGSVRGRATGSTRGFRCPPGFERGGHFTDSRMSTCGRQLFGVPGSSRNTLRTIGAQSTAATREKVSQHYAEFKAAPPAGAAPLPGVGGGMPELPEPVGKADKEKHAASVAKVLESMSGVTDATDKPVRRLIREDGSILQPLAPLEVIGNQKGNSDLKNASLLTRVNTPGAFGLDELLLMQTGLQSIDFSLPGGGSVSLRRNGGLMSPGKARAFGKAIAAARRLEGDSLDYGALLRETAAKTDAVTFVVNLPGEQDPTRIVRVTGAGGEERVPYWVYKAFLEDGAPGKAPSSESYKMSEPVGKSLKAQAVKRLGQDTLRTWGPLQYTAAMIPDYDAIDRTVGVTFKAMAYNGYRRDISWAFVEEKRASSVWDRGVSRFRCPPGTTNGGQITNRLGLGCGQAVVERMFDALRSSAIVADEAGQIRLPGRRRNRANAPNVPGPGPRLPGDRRILTPDLENRIVDAVGGGASESEFGALTDVPEGGRLSRLLARVADAIDSPSDELAEIVLEQRRSRRDIEREARPPVVERIREVVRRPDRPTLPDERRREERRTPVAESQPVAPPRVDVEDPGRIVEEVSEQSDEYNRGVEIARAHAQEGYDDYTRGHLLAQDVLHAGTPEQSEELRRGYLSVLSDPDATPDAQRSDDVGVAAIQDLYEAGDREALERIGREHADAARAIDVDLRDREIEWQRQRERMEGDEDLPAVIAIQDTVRSEILSRQERHMNLGGLAERFGARVGDDDLGEPTPDVPRSRIYGVGAPAEEHIRTLTVAGDRDGLIEAEERHSRSAASLELRLNDPQDRETRAEITSHRELAALANTQIRNIDSGIRPDAATQAATSERVDPFVARDSSLPSPRAPERPVFDAGELDSAGRRRALASIEEYRFTVNTFWNGRIGGEPTAEDIDNYVRGQLRNDDILPGYRNTLIRYREDWAHFQNVNGDDDMLEIPNLTSNRTGRRILVDAGVITPRRRNRTAPDPDPQTTNTPGNGLSTPTVTAPEVVSTATEAPWVPSPELENRPDIARQLSYADLRSGAVARFPELDVMAARSQLESARAGVAHELSLFEDGGTDNPEALLAALDEASLAHAHALIRVGDFVGVNIGDESVTGRAALPGIASLLPGTNMQYAERVEGQMNEYRAFVERTERVLRERGIDVESGPASRILNNGAVVSRTSRTIRREIDGINASNAPRTPDVTPTPGPGRVYDVSIPVMDRNGIPVLDADGAIKTAELWQVGRDRNGREIVQLDPEGFGAVYGGLAPGEWGNVPFLSAEGVPDEDLEVSYNLLGGGTVTILTRDKNDATRHGDVTLSIGPYREADGQYRGRVRINAESAHTYGTFQNLGVNDAVVNRLGVLANKDRAIARIDTFANITIGNYAWARKGFEFSDGETADFVRTNAQVLERFLNNPNDTDARLDATNLVLSAIGTSLTGARLPLPREDVMLREANEVLASYLLHKDDVLGDIAAVASEAYSAPYFISGIGHPGRDNPSLYPSVGNHADMHPGKALFLGQRWTLQNGRSVGSGWNGSIIYPEPAPRPEEVT